MTLNGGTWANGPSDHLRMPPGPDGVRRGYPWESEVGTIYIRPLEAHRVMVDNSGNTIPHVEGRPYLTVRGIEHTASVNVERNEDGEWICSEHVHAHRRGGYQEATAAAERKLVEAIQAAVAEWAETPEAQEMLAEAEATWANNEVYRQAGKVQEAQEALAREEEILNEKQARLFRATNPAVR